MAYEPNFDSQTLRAWILITVHTCEVTVAKMASHAIFQYNVLAIDDTHNTWTNICVKIKNPEEIGSKGPRQR